MSQLPSRDSESSRHLRPSPVRQYPSAGTVRTAMAANFKAHKTRPYGLTMSTRQLIRNLAPLEMPPLACQDPYSSTQRPEETLKSSSQRSTPFRSERSTKRRPLDWAAGSYRSITSTMRATERSPWEMAPIERVQILRIS